MSAKDYFAGRLMAAPEVTAFRLGTDYFAIKYADGTILTVTVDIVNHEYPVMSYDITEQQWEWERGAK